MEGHSTDYCSFNPKNKGKGKGKGKSKGKSKGRGKGTGKGKGKGKAKGKYGRGSGNFPANYNSDEAYYAAEWNSNWESSDDLKEESSSSSASDWNDCNFLTLDNETEQIFKRIFENESEQILFNENEDDIPKDLSASEQLMVILENDNDISAWTQNHLWTQLDFESCTRGVQPTLSADKCGPGCDFLLNAWTLKDQTGIKQQLVNKLQDLEERKAKGETGIWMYLDSGASRSVIQEESPIRALLSNISETQGSCSVGNGASLRYLEKGMLTHNNEVTVVQALKYDLYAAVAAAKRGVSCILDFDANGTNKSFLIDKKFGIVTPLIERKKGILEVPIHLYLDNNEKGLMATEPSTTTTTLSKASISKFWLGMDKGEFDPYIRNNNCDEISLFTFDVINSLGQRQKDFLIHARLAHLPRKAILQLIKNGATGLPYKGKFKELCRPCLESRQRAENHGKQVTRHPNGKFGEHLHSDLAVVNIPDFKGFKYVLTVVDEISDEVIITLLKSKSAEVVLSACKNTHKIITARCKRQIKSWQFDRGSEFLNELFDEWITKELGATQLFSNIEHRVHGKTVELNALLERYSKRREQCSNTQTFPMLFGGKLWFMLHT